MAGERSIYADSSCFIDVVKFDTSAKLSNERHQEVWHFKKLLQAHRDREITVYTSTLTIAEATHIGETPVPIIIQRAFDALLTSGQYCFLVQDTPFISMDVRNLRWKDSIALRGADSIHLASAIDRECVEFISLDRKFKRIDAYSAQLASKGINVVTPSGGTKELPEKYLQEELLALNNKEGQ